MIDPMSSLASALAALAGVEPVTEPGPNDPGFLQVLQAIAGAQRVSCPPGSSLLATIEAAAQTMPTVGRVAQGIIAGLQKLASEDGGGIGQGGEKDLQEDPQTAIEMVLALLSVMSPELKPSTESATNGEVKMVGMEGDAHLSSGNGPRTAVEMAGDPVTRRFSQAGLIATDKGSPAEPAVHRSQLLEVASPVQKPEYETAPVVVPDPLGSGASASIEGVKMAGAPIEGIETAGAPKSQSALLENVHPRVVEAPAVRGRRRLESTVPASWPAPPVHGEAPDPAMPGRNTVTGQAPVQHRQPTLSDQAVSRSDFVGIDDMLNTGTVRVFAEKPGELQPVQHGPPETGPIPAPASEKWLDGQLTSQDGSSKRVGTLETDPALNALQHTSGLANGGFQAVAPEGPGATLPGAPLVEQIAQHAHMVRARGEAGLDIQLEPKELGKVRVFIGLGSDGLHVRLEAESSDTRGMLQASLPQLREALENQGLKVDRFHLALGAGSPGFGSPQDHTSQPHMNSGQRSMPYFWEENAASQPDRTPNLQPPSSLVDYRI